MKINNIKHYYQLTGFVLMLIFVFSGTLEALSVKQSFGSGPFTDLGSFTPGQRKYWQPTAGVGFTIENTSGVSQTVRVDIMNENTLPRGLVLATNPTYYIECTSAQPNFVYHAQGWLWNGTTSTPISINNPSQPLIASQNYIVHQVTLPASNSVTIKFWFDLLVPYKISGQITPFGKYTTNLLYTFY